MNKKILSVVLILCVMLAVMPMTAYAADRALCTNCNQVQTVRVTSQYADGKWHLRHVTCTVCNKEWDFLASHNWSGTATCTSGRTCTVCGGSSEPLGHDWGAWTQNSDEKTHTRICKRDTSHTETENCIDANKDHKCDYCGKKLTEHTGGKVTCKDKAKCEVCGAEYGELDAKNHTDLKHFPSTAATKTTEGNIEYWYCEGCGKYYSDKDGTKEIKKADTVTAKLKDDSKSPQTGDTSNLALWIALLFVSGGAAIGTTVVSRKKKYNK